MGPDMEGDKYILSNKKTVGYDIPTKGVWMEKRKDKRIRWWHIPKNLRIGEVTSVKIYEPTSQDVICKDRQCIANLKNHNNVNTHLAHGRRRTRANTPPPLSDNKVNKSNIPYQENKPVIEPFEDIEPQYQITSMDDRGMVVAKKGGFFTFLVRDFTHDRDDGTGDNKPSLKTLSSRLFSYACPLVLFLILVITFVLICHVSFGQWASVGGIISNIALFSLFFIFGISLL